MSTINKYLLLGLISCTVLITMSCKKRDIKGEEISISNVGLSIKSDNGTIMVPKGENFSVSPENLTIPVEITFSDAVPKRFNVNVSVDNDTITKLINAGKLPNTVLLPSQFYKIPSNVDIGFGMEKYDFDLVVDITAVERNYGKNLALAVELSDPTKNNSLDKKTRKAIIMINTEKVLKEEEIHYVYFKDAGAMVGIPQQGVTYPQSSSTLTVPVSVSLGGIPAAAFNVRLSDNQDTLQKIIAADGSDSLVAMVAGVSYILPDSVDFKSHQGSATFYLEVSVDSLKSDFNKSLLIGLSLEYPTGHLLDSSRRTVVLNLNPSKLVEIDITNLNSHFSASRENDRTSGEGSTNLVDDKINTKFLLFDFQGVWAQLEYDEPQVAGAYTITSANDAPDRDPANWQLQGSDNGTSWTVLDEQSAQSFSARFQTKKYMFKNKTAYKFYRLNIISVAGGNGGLYQQAEWRLIKTP